MEIREYEVEVVTPMFLSGADQKKIELRAPSIKGQLRWWWRAMNGHLELNVLKEQEENIFGTTKKRSSFSIQIDPIQVQVSDENLPKGDLVEVKGKSFKASIIHYLAFGPIDKGKLKRPYIKPGSTFRLKFTFYNDNAKDVLNALYYMVNYGGLGAKSRNGFGSLKAPKISENKKSFKKIPKTRYTTLSKETLLFKFNKHNSWEKALSEVGKAYREARLELEPKHEYAKRVLVAMPIIQDKGTPNDNRHSKPFLIHIDKQGSFYQGKIMYLPHIYYNPFFGDGKIMEYENVMKEMCVIMKEKAREVTNEF